MLLAGDLAQVHGQVRALDAPQLRVGVQLNAHFQGGVLPLLAGTVQLHRVGEALADGPGGVLGGLLLGDVGGTHGPVGLVAVGNVGGLVGNIHIGAGGVGRTGGGSALALALGGLALGQVAIVSLGHGGGVPGAMVVHGEAGCEASKFLGACARSAALAQGRVDALGGHKAGFFGHAL